MTAVRQRVTQQNLLRRGRATDRVWANRRLMLLARERLASTTLARMWNGCLDTEPNR